MLDAIPFTSNGHQPMSPPQTIDAVQYLRQGLEIGRPWADVLLEAVGLWTAPEERYRGRKYTYLLQGEAFDWLSLAERLLKEVDGDTVPQVERERFLFQGQLPSPVTVGRMRKALGEDKYRAHLNFFYGVVVEEALIHAVEEEVLKERRVRGVHHRRGVDDLVMERLYGDALDALVRRFCRERKKRYRGALSQVEWKSFVYWLFKLRIASSDESRLASDTNKGLRHLEVARLARRLG